MKDAEDFENVATNAVGKDVRGSRNHQLAGTGNTAGAADGGLLGETVDGFEDTVGDATSGGRIIAGDPGAGLAQVGDGHAEPDHPHSGASFSSSLPQLSSQSLTA